MNAIKNGDTGNKCKDKSPKDIIYEQPKNKVVNIYSKKNKKNEMTDFNKINATIYEQIFNSLKTEQYKIFNKESFIDNKNEMGDDVLNDSKIDKNEIREEAFTLDNNDKQYIRDAENRIHQAETRINESEKRIYQNNKDMEQRIDNHFNDLKEIIKDYKKDIKEEISKQQKYNEESIKRIEENISKVESNIDSTNKWIIGLCITTIIGIATMAITIAVALFNK